MGYLGMAAPRQSYGVTDFYPKANEQSLVVVLIEEVEAVNNLQDILTMDNIDVYYMARTDLSETRAAQSSRGTGGGRQVYGPDSGSGQSNRDHSGR